MFRKFKLLSIFVMFLYAANAYSVAKKPSTNRETKDLKKVSLYYKYLSKGINKNKLNTKVIKYFKKRPSLFKDEIEIISLQSSINKKPFNISNCLKGKNKYTSKVAMFQYLQVIRFCHNSLLRSKTESELTEKEKLFVKNFYSSLVETKNLGLISLRRKSSIFPQILADIISLKNYDIEEITKLFQYTYIGKHLVYGETLTKHLQQNGLFPGKESRLFKNEFRKICSTTMATKKRGQVNQSLEQVLSFYSENRNLIGHRYANKKFVQLTRFLDRNGEYSLAKRFISRAIGTQKKEFVADLYFERLFLDIKRKNYTDAYKYILRSGLLGHEKNYNSKLRFWVGKVYHKNNEDSLAEFLFKKQIEKNPMNYYSILSSALLKKMGKKKFVEKKYLYNSDQNSLLAAPPDVSSDFSRLKTWLSADVGKVARLEVEEILKREKEPQGRKIASSDLDTSYKILKIFREEEKYLKSFKFFNRNSLSTELSFLPSITKILFPTPYEKNIKKYSRDIDKSLIFSLIRQESAFDPKAKSSAGARGLMQLMPATARMYKKRLRKAELYKPNLNLKLGTKYLKYLLEKYDNSLIYTLASYNAGETNLRRWKKKYLISDNNLINVELIPFSETQGYIKYISRNMFFYRLVFGEPMFKGLDWIKNSI